MTGMILFILGFILLGCAICSAKSEPVRSQNSNYIYVIGNVLIFTGLTLMTVFQDV